jgi:hypothetical protein
MGDIAAYTDDELLTVWSDVTENNMDRRDALVAELERRKLFPSAAMSTWETEAGLYPDSDDPRFIEKLMKKQEFIENRQESLGEQQRRGDNLCDTEREFELTSVQRFISRFLSPQCPYQSALLYHGVGVGKTCAAITTAEEYLRTNPKDAVFIVAPRNIQPGFRRTIFDEEGLVIPKDRALANTANGCTGDSYIKRTGTDYDTDRGLIGRRINQSINSRYKILGYIQFWRYIQDIIDSVKKTGDVERNRQESVKALRRAFDGKLVIIDEAHNLRDAPGETDDDNLDSPDIENDISEAKAGKRLTPTLLRMLSVVQGMKLMLLSGTPMYNSYKEIVFLLNLLLRNDKKAELSERDIFDATGKIKPKGKELLGNAASAYLSFMRGENPLTFPVRLAPRDAPTIGAWPTEDPQGQELTSSPDAVELRKKTLMNLPFVPISFEGEGLKIVKSIANSVIESSGGLGLRSLDEMVQSGNWLFPGPEDADPASRIRDTGFDNTFEEKKTGVALQYASREDVSWLTKGELKQASPKADFILNRIATATGVIFIYSRFIKSGALPMALALEANGYSPWGTNRPLLTNPNLAAGGGRQCALCSARERTHAGRPHPFTPAKYVILTGQVGLSPNNAASIKAARSKENKYGKDVKVVIGSQVASEGIDLRFVREIYVFDSWFHLNKMEQVLGRGVRTCSHSLLKPVERNCTIHLLVNMYGEEPVETADLYMYRIAMNKAVQIGRVTRVLKEYALDCNLNLAANYVNDLDPIDKLEDSQGKIRGIDDTDPNFKGKPININDTPYTSICDWTECPYTCAKPVDLKEILAKKEVDMSTYDEYAMRWRESQLKELLKHLFEAEQQPNIQMDALNDALREAGIPDVAIRILLGNIVDNKSFRIRIKNQEGYITYRNTYYLFQPIRLADVRIPLALRIADVPVGRDEYIPVKYKYATPTAPIKAPVIEGPIAEEGAEGAKGAEGAEAEAPIAVAEEGPDAYWKACVDWSRQIRNGDSPLDIPPEVVAALNKRYVGESYKREFNILSMISWMYENIRNSPEIGSDENRVKFREALADTFTEIIWDESLKPNEQLAIFSNPALISDELTRAISEQKLTQGDRDIFRFVDPTTGLIEYRCGSEKCSQAVVKVIDTDKADPLNLLQANRDTTGAVYGFVLPKVKEGKFILKTSDRSVNKGAVPEKGKECENVSTIDGHKVQLRQIRDMIIARGYPPFLLSDVVLNEKEGRAKEADKGGKKKKEDDGLSPMEREQKKMREKLFKDVRKFQNVVKACALKNIILRMVDKMESKKGGLRYFYRPVAAIKTRHKLK